MTHYLPPHINTKRQPSYPGCRFVLSFFKGIRPIALTVYGNPVNIFKERNVRDCFKYM